MKAMNLHTEGLEDQLKGLAAENESPHVSNEDILSLPINLLRLKRSIKRRKKLSKDIDVQYHSIAIHLESLFRALCVKEGEELQPFCFQPKLETCCTYGTSLTHHALKKDST